MAAIDPIGASKDARKKATEKQPVMIVFFQPEAGLVNQRIHGIQYNQLAEYTLNPGFIAPGKQH